MFSGDKLSSLFDEEQKFYSIETWREALGAQPLSVVAFGPSWIQINTYYLELYLGQYLGSLTYWNT